VNKVTLNIENVPTQADFASTLAAHSWVAQFDCPDCPAIELLQFRTAFSYLSLSRQRQTINYRRSCYSLKHDCEDATGHYVSERAYILAAIMAGFTAKVRGPCCFLNLRDDAREHERIEMLSRARKDT